MTEARVQRVGARAYRVPTPGPEADGTLAWDGATIVVVRIHAGGAVGLGWTYADAACVPLISRTLAPVIVDQPVLDVPVRWMAMQRQIRKARFAGSARGAWQVWHRAVSRTVRSGHGWCRERSVGVVE